MANMTRQDAQDFLTIAHHLNIRPQVTVFSLDDANKTLLAVKEETEHGSTVIVRKSKGASSSEPGRSVIVTPPDRGPCSRADFSSDLPMWIEIVARRPSPPLIRSGISNAFSRVATGAGAFSPCFYSLAELSPDRFRFQKRKPV